MRAMLGEITPEIRAITVYLAGRRITVRVFREGAASEDLAEAREFADTEILADFPASGEDAISLQTLLVRCDETIKIPSLGMPVFVRKGTYFQH
jgi:hypothetical protein